MKLILIKDVDNLGNAGDVVNVKNGYGRNYLIPQGMARLATTSNINAHQEQLRQAAHKLAKFKDDAQQLAKKLEEMEIVIPAKVGEENRIFGTVTTQQIADVLNAKGLDIDRRKIEVHEDIRALGVYPASVHLYSDVIAQVKVQVVPGT